MANATQQHIEIKPKKPFDPAATLVRHWFKIAVFGGIMFLLLSPLAFLLTKPHYEVSGKLVVLPETESMITRRDEGSVAGYYTQFINMQLDALQSPRILEKAIDNLPPEIKKHFLTEGMSLSHAARILRSGLSVSQPRGTHFIEIKMARGDDKGLIDIVNSIMTVFLEEYQKDEEGKEYRRLAYLQVEKESLNSDIEKQSEQLKNVSQEIASSVFSGNNDEAARFQTAYENAYRDRVEKENRLKAIISEAEALKELSLDAYIREMIENNTLVSQLEKLSQESLHKFREFQFGLSSENPGRKQLEERINSIKKHTSEQKGIIEENIRKLLYEKRETELKEKIIHAETELNAAKMIEEEILKKRNQLLTQRAEITAKELTRRQIETSLEQMKNHLNKIDTRFYELKLESKSPGKVRLDRMADVSGMSFGSNRKKLIVLIFILSFGGIAGACTFFDILDDRIRSEKDILSCLGTTPHKPIADYLEAGMKDNTPFARVLLDDPTNKVAQSIHSLAIKLDKERRNHEARVAVFTGVDSKSGVTEILLNTACAMSRLCPRVLVIEGNFAHPSMKDLIRAKKVKHGLLDLIAGKAILGKCITRDKDRNIDVLLSGRVPSEEDLVNLDRSGISTLLENLKKDYDFILIDTMPMLISDLAEFLIVQSDIVSMVVQADRSLYKFTYMAGQTLFKLEVPAIATVFNYGAPRYKTRIQEFIFRVLWPYQSWLKETLFGTLNPVPKQPYPTAAESAKNAAVGRLASLKKAVKSDLSKKIIFNAGKSIIILFLFIQLTLFMTFISSTAKVDTVTNGIEDKKTISPSNSDSIREKGFETCYTSDPASLTLSSIDKTTCEKENMSEYQKPGNIGGVTIMDENWILKQEPGQYTIQILGMAYKDQLLKFAGDHKITENAALYHTKFNGRAWYSLVYGLYPGYGDAAEKIRDLPAAVLETPLRIIEIDVIQQTIRSACEVKSHNVSSYNCSD